MSESPVAGSAGERDVRGRYLFVLSLTALGIVFGDIGTSPLYAIRECFHGEFGIEPSHQNVLGILSLMLWALVLVASVKYLTFILRADNHGEGGVLALTALVRSHLNGERGRRWVLVAFGLFGASLLYGDGMITPSISVLSAVEGLRIITPVFRPYVVPATAAILAVLFLFQRHGTAKVGALFGPITLVWFVAIGAIGVVGIAREPRVLLAVSPTYGAAFLLHNGFHGFLVLGAVFLVVTGAEALYADMGHFGRKPIRAAWFYLVLPSLLLNYYGQGAHLLGYPQDAHHPFYALVPAVLLIPMVVLATAATIIASQAVISGAFSLTRQAIQLGYLPRLRIVHTSATEIGQIYVPEINYLLMVTTVALVFGFQSSSKLAAAYGVAVTSTMVITSILFYFVARDRWGWGRAAALSLVALFLVVDLAFFGANMTKIAHGAWFPLVIGVVSFTLMTTWKRGRELMSERFLWTATSVEDFLIMVSTHTPQRVQGKAVFMSGNPKIVPTPLLHNLKHNKILHSEIVVLNVLTAELPRVPRDEKVEVRDLGQGFHRVTARFGFMEDPNVPYVLALAREKGLDFDVEEVSFFLGRERLLPAKKPGMSVWRNRIFAFMSRNALGATAFFHIPPRQVVELGAQIEI